MGLMYRSVKPVKVYYQCDNCQIGLPEIVDSYKEKDDEDEMHTYYVYECPSCGIREVLEDLKFPYIDFIEYDDLMPYKVWFIISSIHSHSLKAKN